MPFVVLLLLNFVGAWWVAENLGKQREIGYRRSLIISFLLTPIVGLLACLMTPKLPFEV